MGSAIKAVQKDNSVIVHGVKDFNPKHIFECGQCFRWNRQDDGSYTGVAYGKVINVSYMDSVLSIKNTDINDFNYIWREYFDLDTDYSYIKKKLMVNNNLGAAIEFGWGIRILKQEMWECLISFIISANNIIPRIKKIVNSICKEYGNPITYNREIYYTFPEPEKFADKNIEDLSFCKSGYRARYIIRAAQMVNDKTINLKTIYEYNTVTARKELMKIPGIGPKVADCILLFSMGKYDVFPTDVWVRRIMGEINKDKSISANKISIVSPEDLGGLAGYAQQYLFYYAREMKIGKN